MALWLATDAPGAPSLITFDDLPDNTVVNNWYPGVTFSNPITTTAGGNIYARNSMYAPSPANVVSVFASGFPEFHAYYGAVDARFATPMRTVSIDARPEAPVELLLPLTKRPFLQAFDAADQLLGTVYYVGVLPGLGAIGPAETLSFTSPAGTANIAKVRFSTQNPVGVEPTYGLFDNLRYDRGYYTLTPAVQGGGSVTVSPVQAEYFHGTLVTLKAAFAPGWAFTGWSGSASGSNNPLTVTMTADTAVTALFSTLVSNIVKDNHTASLFGSGWSSQADPSCYGPDCVTVPAGGLYQVYAFYQLSVTVPGQYDVYAWCPDTRGYGAENAAYRITHAKGNATYYLDQSIGSGRWYRLASKLPFAPGAPASVRISSPTSEPGHALIADAVRLVWSAEQPLPEMVASCSMAANGFTVSWASIPGRTYRVRYSASLSEGSWIDLPGDVTAAGWTANRLDYPGPSVSKRFYQVFLLPQ